MQAIGIDFCKKGSRPNHHVSDTSQKSEGDVRENRLPSRAFIPLYIGI